MSPSEAKAKHSATDLIKWDARFSEELNEFHREDYGVARVAYEVYELRATLSAIFGGKLAQKKVEDFITTFAAKEAEIPIAELPDDEREAKIKEISENSRAFWFAGLGLDADGKPIKTVEEQLTPGQLSAQRTREKALQALEAASNAVETPVAGSPAVKQKTRRVVKPGGG